MHYVICISCEESFEEEVNWANYLCEDCEQKEDEEADRMKEAIYRFTADAVRHGTFYGIFVAKKSDVLYVTRGDKVIEIDGGHHCVIRWLIEPKDFEIVTDDLEVIKMFKLYDFSSGIDPVNEVFVQEGLI